MERPFVWVDAEGQPDWLFVAVWRKDENRSWNLALPLRQ